MSHPFLTTPSTTPDPDDENAVKNYYSTVISALILTLVLLLGVPGNIFVIWSILARIRQRSVTTLLILNLACADAALMVITIFVIVYVALKTWIFGNTMCKILFYLCNSNMFASVFLITLMSVHRLVAVVFPHTLSHRITRKVVRVVIVGMWVLVMVISIPSLVFRNVKEGTDDMNNTRQVCAPNYTLPKYVRFQYILETVAGFIIPYTIIIISYLFILKRLRETKFQRKVRSEKLILTIVIMFGLFWLPYHVINMIQVAATWYPKDSHTKKILHNISENSRAVTSALAFLSSCANPVLYTFAGKSYIRKNGFAFMAKVFEGTSSEQAGSKPDRTTNKEELRKSKVDFTNCTLLCTQQNKGAE